MSAGALRSDLVLSGCRLVSPIRPYPPIPSGAGDSLALPPAGGGIHSFLRPSRSPGGLCVGVAGALASNVKCLIFHGFAGDLV